MCYGVGIVVVPGSGFGQVYTHNNIIHTYTLSYILFLI